MCPRTAIRSSSCSCSQNWPTAQRRSRDDYVERTLDKVFNSHAFSGFDETVRMAETTRLFEAAKARPSGSEESPDTRSFFDDEPLPLHPEPTPADPYPVEALGDVLSGAALAISRVVQVPEAMAAQSVLGAASLATQALADVAMPFGQTRPISLYFATGAESGDRKSTADRFALEAVRGYEEALSERSRTEWHSWKNRSDAWAVQRKMIEKNKEPRSRTAGSCASQAWTQARRAAEAAHADKRRHD